jgi:chaperonin GroES
VTSDTAASPDVTPRADGSLPIKLLHDRLLVRTHGPEGERKTSGGILIPATAEVARRLAWAKAVAVGPNVRTVDVGDQVLFDPEAPAHVELQGREYLLLRERDVHAVAGTRHSDAGTGLYL